MNKSFIRFITTYLAAISLIGSSLTAIAQGTTTQPSAAKPSAADELKEIKGLHKVFKDVQDKIKADEKNLKSKTAKIREEAKKRIEENRKKAEEQRKVVVARLIDNEIKQLQNTKERVAKMPNITDALKSDLSAKIDVMIADLNAKKAALQSAATADDVKKIAKEVKDSLKSHRDLIQEIVAAILASRLQNAVSKAEERIAQLDTQVKDLKAAGKDAGIAEGKLTAAKAALDMVKRDLSDKKVKEANADLKKVYELLREVVRNLQ